MPTINRQPLLDTRQNQLALVISQGQSIDAKALALLGSNVAVLIFVAQAQLQLVAWQWLLLAVPFIGSLAYDVKQSGRVSIPVMSVSMTTPIILS